MTPELGSEYDVPDGAIAAAIDWIEALHGVPLTERRSTRLPTISSSTLSSGAGRCVKAGPDEPDLLDDLVPAIITRLLRTNLPQVPPEQLPTAAGVVTAAVLGQDVYAWRRSLGPLTIADRRVYAYVLWLLVELLDLGSEPGYFAHAMRRLLAGDLSVLADPDDQAQH